MPELPGRCARDVGMGRRRGRPMGWRASGLWTEEIADDTHDGLVVVEPADGKIGFGVVHACDVADASTHEALALGVERRESARERERPIVDQSHLGWFHRGVGSCLELQVGTPRATR